MNLGNRCRRDFFERVLGNMPKITPICPRIFQKYRRKYPQKKIPRKSVLSLHFFVGKSVLSVHFLVGKSVLSVHFLVGKSVLTIQFPIRVKYYFTAFRSRAAFISLSPLTIRKYLYRVRYYSNVLITPQIYPQEIRGGAHAYAFEQ